MSISIFRIYPVSGCWVPLLFEYLKSSPAQIDRDKETRRTEGLPRTRTTTKPPLRALKKRYETRETVEKYSYVAAFDEIKENDFNLNIPRYVDTFEEEELVDIDEVKQNIANIEAELAQVQAQMAKYLETLGL